MGTNEPTPEAGIDRRETWSFETLALQLIEQIHEILRGEVTRLARIVAENPTDRSETAWSALAQDLFTLWSILNSWRGGRFMDQLPEKGQLTAAIRKTLRL